ncbi:MAG: hypothetical protein AAF389_20910 [Gemmatimonadota bacterium]
MKNRALELARQVREPVLLALSGFLLMMSMAAIGAGNEAARAALEAEARAGSTEVVIAATEATALRDGVRVVADGSMP